MNDITLISCSYNTPQITLTMLKSFRKLHPELESLDIILMENSTNEETVELLKENNVPFVRNIGFTHNQGMEVAFDMCKTKYAIVVDTDIVFRKNITDLYNLVKENNWNLVGTECGDRGGLKLFPRIHPWFMIVDVEYVKANKIVFCDMVKMEQNNSSHLTSSTFVNYIPEHRVYDIGSTFYEDLKNVGADIKHYPECESYYEHYEGSSWHRDCPIKELAEVGQKTWNRYQKEIELVKDVNIDGFFVS